MKHFKLTENFKINVFGIKLYQIELTIDCKWGKVGDLGGWIEKEDNTQGDAWVSGDAEVCGNARVYGDAWVCGNAWVSGDAEVCGNARVYGDAWVCGNARVYGNARVSGNARVYGDAEVCGNAEVCGDAWVYGDAWKKSPLQIQGTRHFICESKKGYLKIGCLEYTFTEWKNHFKLIGEREGYSEKEIAEYGCYIDLAVKLQEIYK